MRRAPAKYPLGGPMLDYVVRRTTDFVRTKPKEARKSSGQFFTSKSTARFMAGMFDLPQKDTVGILDPGAGSGIPSTAAVETVSACGHIREI